MVVGLLPAGPLAAAETRSHFFAWCIVSSPLVLGFDLTNETTLEAVWGVVSNSEAIAVNQAWAGHPGMLLNLTTADNNADGPGKSTQVVPHGTSSMQVWAKPLPAVNGTRTALLAINLDGTRVAPAGTAEVGLGQFFGKQSSCAIPGTVCSVRDVGSQTDAGTLVDDVWRVGTLGPHDSSFVIVTLHHGA